MDHLVLCFGTFGPGWRAIVGLLLKREAHATLGIAHEDEVVVLRRDRPAEQTAVEVCHRSSVGAVDVHGLEAQRRPRGARRLVHPWKLSTSSVSIFEEFSSM